MCACLSPTDLKVFVRGLAPVENVGFRLKTVIIQEILGSPH